MVAGARPTSPASEGLPHDYTHPLAKLAADLGHSFPPRREYRLLTLWALPAVALCGVALVWSDAAALLLTFAGAFASIQAAPLYKTAVEGYKAHLEMVRENRLGLGGVATAGWSGSRSCRCADPRHPDHPRPSPEQRADQRAVGGTRAIPHRSDTSHLGLRRRVRCR